MDKIRLAITGLNGFIGWHFNQFNQLQSMPFELISIGRDDFDHPEVLTNILSDCQGVIHIAGVNRVSKHGDIAFENEELARKIVAAIRSLKNAVSVFYTSSIQELEQNEYGHGKRNARLMLEEVSRTANTNCLSWLVPNVFGPFCKPFYNSVVSTFCHQIWSNQELEIKVDKEIPLVFVQNLVKQMWLDVSRVLSPENNIKCIRQVEVEVEKFIKVSDLLQTLKGFHATYVEKGILPDLSDSFTRNLFNTFLTYSSFDDFFPFQLKKHSDIRGSFVEIAKLGGPGQISFSTTVPGVTRGNHFHTRKSERFAVIKGKARIDFRKIDEERIFSFFIEGEEPSFVDMPIWYTHNITNIGDDMLYTVFWINEPYDPSDGDTFANKV